MCPSGSCLSPHSGCTASALWETRGHGLVEPTRYTVRATASFHFSSPSETTGRKWTDQIVYIFKVGSVCIPWLPPHSRIPGCLRIKETGVKKKKSRHHISSFQIILWAGYFLNDYFTPNMQHVMEKVCLLSLIETQLWATTKGLVLSFKSVESQTYFYK